MSTEEAFEKVDPRKLKALESALAGIEKQFGKGSVVRLGQASRLNVDAIPTGSIALDLALGVGGIPRGRITEIYGTESSGKTTIALQCIAQAQKKGGICAYIDVEHAIDPEYARKIGVDVDNLFISQPTTGEEALDIMDALIRSSAIDVCVLDSVAALVPKAELEGDMGESHVGVHARLMSQALRKVAGTISRTNTAAIFINQIRQKIGVMFGNPETTSGGLALKYYASVRLEVRRTETVKNGADPVGARVKVKVVKNKVAPPFRQAEFDILFGRGISRAGGVLDMGVELGLVQKSGSYFSYGDVRLGQGRENARTFLEEHEEILDEIENKIRATASAVPVIGAADLEEVEAE
ncbi:RecA protein [Chthonomonas calidirosea]|uniref:Protein RecA n=1 Tax=Chthonomonas calidirosea (strain DSM 23976 / ICMP 18418 / T49) TaxID=1303518 RepID=S0EW72_CHTCT|nr:recombinase RecA [Chthonomonas calidirosea]CCW35684.1 RecA protein [Chthonomonas calidirosea T49]CEK18528.1 RecA protein [Chthonomonas calidirosea]CEK18530.1 RecA protein [Chthonomonas calidirosea]CEK19540.1 RecA protein [Chthonomonas calidirosea]